MIILLGSSNGPKKDALMSLFCFNIDLIPKYGVTLRSYKQYFVPEHGYEGYKFLVYQ